MQAADLLAVIAPAPQGKGGPIGAAAGKGVGLGADPTATDGQGAAGVADSFAQALAAMMGLAGQVQAPVQQAAAPTEETAETPPAGGEPKNKGIATAMAATTRAGAEAIGLAKQVTDAAPAADEGPVANTAAVADAAAVIAAPLAEGAKTTPATAQASPPTAKAAEAHVASSPRAERPEQVAQGPRQPTTASGAAPSDPLLVAPAASQVPPPPAVDGQAAPPPVEAQVALPSVEGQTQAAAVALAQAAPTTKTTDTQKADGKAAKAEGKGKADEASGLTHGPRGVGKGLETAPGQAKKPETEESALKLPAPEPKAADVETAQAGPDASSVMVADQTQAAPVAAHVDGGKFAAHTVAHLASQIISKADGKSTRFDVTLDPAGLGKVDVKIEIGRGGEINAALSFDNPQAAAEMRSRAGELRSALEQAGFDLSKGGLSFDLSGQSGGRQFFDQHQEAPRATWARAAFTDLSMATEPAPITRMIDAGGVDVTI